MCGPDFSFTRLWHVVWYLVLAVFIAPAISASIGVSSLWMSGVVPDAQYAPAWTAWWLGDMLGALIVTPLLRAWITEIPVRIRSGLFFVQAAVLMAVLAVGAYLFFVHPIHVPFEDHHFVYIFFIPFLIAAFRFGQRGNTTAIFILSAIAIYGTAVGQAQLSKAAAFDPARGARA
jgi:integral membrane sensor domain MASE1